MAESKTKSEAPVVSLDAITAAFAAAMQQVAPPKPFDMAEYLQRPENRDPAEKLTQKVLQNGQRINLRGCGDDTIKHLNELEPGVYLDGRVTVALLGNKPHQFLDIEYPWGSSSERMQNHTLFTSFSDLLQKINKEQKARKQPLQDE